MAYTSEILSTTIPDSYSYKDMERDLGLCFELLGRLIALGDEQMSDEETAYWNSTGQFEALFRAMTYFERNF